MMLMQRILCQGQFMYTLRESKDAPHISIYLICVAFMPKTLEVKNCIKFEFNLLER